MKPKLYIVDGNNWFRRRAEANTFGTPVRGCFQEIVARGPMCIVVWDGFHAKKPRKDIYPEYKANRNKPGESFFESQKLFQQVLEFSACMQIRIDYFEADDVIAHLVGKYRDTCNIFLDTNDLDMYSLGVPMARDKYPDLPHRIAIMKATVGDPSDNIPGIKGFGKTSWEKATDAQKDMLHQIVASPHVLSAEEIKQKVGDWMAAKPLNWFVEEENQKMVKMFYKIVNFIPVPDKLVEENTKVGLNRPDLAENIFREFML